MGRYFVDYTQTELFNSNELVSDDKLRQFIEFYRDENIKLHGESYAKNVNNSVDTLCGEARRFAFHAIMVDTLFCVWMASEALKINDKAKLDKFLVDADKRFLAYFKYKKRFLASSTN